MDEVHRAPLPCLLHPITIIIIASLDLTSTVGYACRSSSQSPGKDEAVPLVDLADERLSCLAPHSHFANTSHLRTRTRFLRALAHAHSGVVCPSPCRATPKVSASLLSSSKYIPSKSRPTTASNPTSAAPSTSSSPTLAPAPATLRSLVFNGSIPLQLDIARNELPPSADRTIETHYVQAPRIAYLPLLLPEIKKQFIDLVLDPTLASLLSLDDVWLEYNGTPLKWHWPIGLLYDYHSASLSSSASTPRSSPRASPSPDLLTLRGFSSTLPSDASSSPSPPPTISLPWKLTLHLKDPPTDALLLGSGIEACRGCFMNMIKEADYVRWGSVKRVTNLRKEQQDGLWEGVVNNDLDKFWSIASRLIPLPPTSSSSYSAPPSPALSSTPSDGRLPDANSVKSVPLRIYLPEGGPVLQELVAPFQDNGSPTTLLHHLSTCVPLLFPPPPPAFSFDARQKPLAQVVIHGIVVPLEAEVGYLGATMSGADGWVAVVVGLLNEEP